METVKKNKKTNTNIIPTWGADELAEYLGKKRSTIKTYMSTKRKTLPPCIKGFKSRWSPAVVYAFYEEKAITSIQNARGQPRKDY